MNKPRIKECGIYKIECIPTGKIYIGSSDFIYRRFGAHRRVLNKNKHDNEYLQRAWNKHGSINFIFSVVEICSEVDLLSRELYFMQKYKSFLRKFGFNLVNNPIRKTHSEETKLKLSKKRIGCLNPFYGKEHSKEAKEKISRFSCGKNNPFYGRKHTSESKEKISKSSKSRTHPLSSREKVSRNNPRRKFTDSQITKIRHLCKQGNFTQATIANLYNTDSGTISRIKNKKIYIFVEDK